MSHRVLVTRPLPGDAVTLLAERGIEVDIWPSDEPPGRAELLTRLRGCQGAVTMLTDAVDAELLDAAPDLKVVANYAVGTDNIDVAECVRRGVRVGNTPGVLTAATADLTWALILAAARRLGEAQAAVIAGDWTTWKPSWLLGTQIEGATLGIIGPGAIGAAVARRTAGFDMSVLRWGRTGSRPELESLLRQSDVVSIHCPLTPRTRGLIGAEEFALMKPDAILVNTARGPIVDQAALVDALRTGQIAAAGLDVTVSEPIDPADPLLRLSNCIVLPHIGSATHTARFEMARISIENVIAGLSGRTMPAEVTR